MNTRSRSVAAIIAGLVAFLAAGAVVLGVSYVLVVHILPQPGDWKTLRTNVEGTLCFLVSTAFSSVVGGYITARVAARAQFVHSATVIALLCLLRQAYILWGPDTLWDLGYGPLLLTAVGLPFFGLGTWLGSRRLRRVLITNQKLGLFRVPPE